MHTFEIYHYLLKVRKKGKNSKRKMYYKEEIVFSIENSIVLNAILRYPDAKNKANFPSWPINLLN